MENLLNDDIMFYKRKTRRVYLIFTIIILIFLTLSIIFIILYASEKDKNNNNNIDDNKEKDKENPTPSPTPTPTPEKEFLTLWNEVDSKNILINYIKDITNEKGINYVPKEDRIAVFDFDGTLFQETDPMYTDYKIYMYRVLDDPDYNATDEQIQLANELKELAKNGEMPKLNATHAVLNAQIYANMEIEEIYDYTKKYVNQPADGYDNMKRGDAFYKPMLEVIDYLQENDFIVYVVTGTDGFTARALIEGHINIPKSQIIGTEARIISNNQNNKDGYEYIFTREDKLIFKGELIAKNLNMNKVYYIMREIGKKPILAFGNSGSDTSMAELALQNKNGKAFMVLCDDIIRERGDTVKAESFKETCNENGWITISMKNDWKTIYGDDVKKKNN
jgi:phosphoglycolate phosphatase-like HAD superfamily hydrolase